MIDLLKYVPYLALATASLIADISGAKDVVGAAKGMYKGGHAVVSVAEDVGHAVEKKESKVWQHAINEKHHTIPKEIIEKLPPELQKHPDVRGRRGLPNRKEIPYEKHREIHQGAGGGKYNEEFKKEIMERGGYENVSPKDVVGIRDKLVKDFEL